jgi:hypothetical protein
MDRFYIIVSSIALVFLILILIFFGLMSSSRNQVVYPPISMQCPDGWRAYDASNCLIPPSGTRNTGNIWSGSQLSSNFSNAKYTPGINVTDPKHPRINFSDAGWSTGVYAGLKPICAQQQWATQNGIFWDGVSNYNSCR